MLKNYELLYIVHPDLEGTTDKIVEKVANFITKIDGKVLNQEDWGKRKLAYSIARNDLGVYILVQFEAESTKLKELERNLRLSEEIMRSIIVALPEEKTAKKSSSLKPKKTKVESPETSVIEKLPEDQVKATEEDKKIEKSTEEIAKKIKSSDDSVEVSAENVEKKTEKPKVEIKIEKKEDDEKDRMKKLDQKLEEILGEDKK